MSNNKNNFINLNNARQDEQIAVMQEIAKEGHCPFCEENLRRYHQQPILKEGRFWLATLNQWPYPHTKQHFLLIYRQHATCLAELDPAAGEELFTFARELEKEYQIAGGGLAMRFGDTDFSAGTVNHLHVQLIAPDALAPDFEPVRVKLGLQREKRSK
jgi:diadenosine tetraphosphate (Ap4A) HIT family hydrolase